MSVFLVQEEEWGRGWHSGGGEVVGGERGVVAGGGMDTKGSLPNVLQLASIRCRRLVFYDCEAYCFASYNCNFFRRYIRKINGTYM